MITRRDEILIRLGQIDFLLLQLEQDSEETGESLRHWLEEERLELHRELRAKLGVSGVGKPEEGD